MHLVRKLVHLAFSSHICTHFWKGNIFKNLFVERKLHYYLIIIDKTTPDDI